MSPIHYVETDFGQIVAQDYLTANEADEHWIEIHVLSAHERIDKTSSDYTIANTRRITVPENWIKIEDYRDSSDEATFLGNIVHTLADLLNPEGDSHQFLDSPRKVEHGIVFRIWRP